MRYLEKPKGFLYTFTLNLWAIATKFGLEYGDNMAKKFSMRLEEKLDSTKKNNKSRP